MLKDKANLNGGKFINKETQQLGNVLWNKTKNHY